MFLWERLRVLSPRSTEFEAVEPKIVVVEGVEKEKTTKYRPKGLRCAGVNSKNKKTLSNEIDLENSYTFRTH